MKNLEIKNNKSLFILVDGSSYLFRAYHALPPLNNSKGEPTGAIYGVLNMLRRLLKDYQPQHVAVVFDPKGKTFRHRIYPEYKANRAVMPDELRVQIEPLQSIIKAMGLPLIIKNDVEADDVIATLANQAQQQQLSVLISTMDKDLAQIVTDHITLINTMSNKLLDPESVKEKFGVMPYQMIDYLALIGDNVDNIPGVPKVGAKTAAKWLAQYQSLDNIIQQADQISGKIGENLRAHLTQLPLSKELVTIKTDVKLDISPIELTAQPADHKTLIEFFNRFEFKSWLSELSQSPEKQSASIKRQYHTILDEKSFNDLIERLAQANYFAFDTETDNLDAIQANIVGIAIAIKPHEAYYIPVAHDYMNAPKQLSREWVLNKLKPLLTNQNTKIIGQNIKYDMQVLFNYDIDVDASYCDTMLEHYVLDSVHSRHDLDSLALKYLGEQTIKFEQVAGKGAKQITFNQVDLEQATPYAAEDADITLRLHHKLWSEITSVAPIEHVLTTIEWPLVKVLAKIERHGVLIDAKLLAAQSKQLAKEMIQLEKQAYEQAGQPFNLSSPKQLQDILYDKMQLPILKRTPKGQASTAENVLQELALSYDLPKLILQYRSLSKLKSTYTDALPQQINPTTQRVHTSYNQAVTSTGRLSSASPNLQNIPARSEQGRRIRQAFIAPQGYRILAADYSQVELRIMAHLSQDPGLLNAFASQQDIHSATAAEVFAVGLESVTAEQRRRAKAINFGLMYGMSAYGLSMQLSIDRGLAQQYMDTYFDRYPNVKAFMQQACHAAAKQGYVETLFGRRLYTPDINASNMQRKRAAQRAAINAPLQGTAADIIKVAMIKIQQWIESEAQNINMIMQVHDELVFEVPQSQTTMAALKIKHLMETAVEMTVPLIVDVGIGDNWDAAH